MLTVIKKDLRKQDFSIEKIKTSISNSADDIGFMFNQVDLNMIGRDVEKKIIGIRGINGETSSYEIRCIVYEVLRDLSFIKVSNSYYNHCLCE